MRSRCQIALPLVFAASALTGCAFYNFASVAGDLGVDGLKDTATLAPLPDTEASKSIPVVVLVHGFTASTYEMSTAASHLSQRGFIVSRPLLGAHGTSVEEFGRSTWRLWGDPIAAEYSRLKIGGYKDVSFLTASTGGTVVMQLYTDKRLSPMPTRISMVAPPLDFTDKLTGAAGLLKAVGAKGLAQDVKGSSKGHWYKDRPIDAILQLIDLTETLKGRLRSTLTIPDDTRIQIFQSKRDGTVDPLSAQLWASGIVGGAVDVEMLDTDEHVPIGPDWTDDQGQNKATAASRALRDRILSKVASVHCPGTFANDRCQ